MYAPMINGSAHTELYCPNVGQHRTALLCMMLTCAHCQHITMSAINQAHIHYQLPVAFGCKQTSSVYTLPTIFSLLAHQHTGTDNFTITHSKPGSDPHA